MPSVIAFIVGNEAAERFSYYGMRAILIYYLTQHFLFEPKVASAHYGSYTSLVYLLPLIGGFLAGPLHIGVWPLLYGFTMWLTTAMNPPAADPIQQKIFQFFPIIFTFTLSQFSVGLVIYWCWSNVLTIFQQYIIMRRYQVENPIDKIIARFQGKTATAT